MMRKILGALFFVAALLSLVGYVANGSLFIEQGSVAATSGRFIGIAIPIVLYVLSGIFLITFDNSSNVNFIDGFRKRSKQAAIIWAFTIVYGVLVFIGYIGIMLAISNTYIENIFIFMVIKIAPYLIPFAIFISLLQIYAVPHIASKKYFLNNEALIKEYLSPDETFKMYSNDGFIMASKKALFFTNLFCVVPFDKIDSIKHGQILWEHYVYLDLLNKKRISVETKHYDCIVAAINDNK